MSSISLTNGFHEPLRPPQGARNDYKKSQRNPDTDNPVEIGMSSTTEPI